MVVHFKEITLLLLWQQSKEFHCKKLELKTPKIGSCMCVYIMGEDPTYLLISHDKQVRNFDDIRRCITRRDCKQWLSGRLSNWKNQWHLIFPSPHSLRELLEMLWNSQLNFIVRVSENFSEILVRFLWNLREISERASCEKWIDDVNKTVSNSNAGINSPVDSICLVYLFGCHRSTTSIHWQTEKNVDCVSWKITEKLGR